MTNSGRCCHCLEVAARLDVLDLCQQCSWLDWDSPIAFARAKQGKYKGAAIYWIAQDDPAYYALASANSLPGFSKDARTIREETDRASIKDAATVQGQYCADSGDYDY